MAEDELEEIIPPTYQVKAVAVHPDRTGQSPNLLVHMQLRMIIGSDDHPEEPDLLLHFQDHNHAVTLLAALIDQVQNSRQAESGTQN